MPDETDLIRQVVTALEELAIPYMIGGSVALAVWAVPRTTHDLDLVVDLPVERIPDFCRHFPAERYTIEAGAMRAAFQQRHRSSLGMYSFTDMESGFKVDLFPLRPGDPAQQAALGRRRVVELLVGLFAAVYAPDDLLVQKLRWYAMSESERQFRDCLNLALTDLNRPTPQIAWEYVESWATQLGPTMAQAWARLKAAVQETSPTGRIPLSPAAPESIPDA